MEDNRDKKPVNKGNPFREWLSDNLRYIILVVAIVAIIAAVIFGVRVISSHLNGDDGQSSQKSAGQDQQGTSPEPTASPSATATPQATATPEATTTPEATPTPTEEPETLKAAERSVSEVVIGYFNAMAGRDADTLSAFVDQLSEEDKATVENNQLIESYSDITVYTYPGPEKNTYVAFASYNYKYRGYDTEIPALTQLYLYQKEDGKLCIASEVTEESVNSYISQILEKEDVRQLVADTQREYENVLSAHADLKAYVDSLN